MIENEGVHDVSDDLFEVFTDLMMTTPKRYLIIYLLIWTKKNICAEGADVLTVGYLPGDYWTYKIDLRMAALHCNPASSRIAWIDRATISWQWWRSRPPSLPEQPGSGHGRSHVVRWDRFRAQLAVVDILNSRFLFALVNTREAR